MEWEALEKTQCHLLKLCHCEPWRQGTAPQERDGLLKAVRALRGLADSSKVVFVLERPLVI